jgi:Ca-activated chloride channel homolog
MRHLKKIKIKERLLLVLSLFLLADSVRAQVVDDDDAPIKVSTLLLTAPLTVSDKNGRNVAGLKKENFSIFQNNERQDVEFLFNEDAPMNVAILLDTSGSTKEVLGRIQKAARDFLKVFRAEDKGIIVTFDSRTQFLTSLTSNRKDLSRAIDRVIIADQTGSNMYDAVFQVVNTHFADFKGRKAIIVLTDGMVYGRSFTAQQAMNSLQQSDVLFYPIVFKTKVNSAAKIRGKNPLPIEILELFANQTSGRFYERDAANLSDAFQSISEELKKQYLIGFYPRNAEPGRIPTHIRIVVDREDFKVDVKRRWNFN